MNLKFFAILLIVVIIVNLVSFAFGLISPVLLWIIIVIIGFIAYKVMPKLKTQE